MKITLGSFASLARALRYGSRIRPVRDWLVLLAIFAAALCVSVGWNLWLFSRVTNGEALGEAAPADDATLELAPVRALFEERAAERARYVNGYQFVDPSR